MLQQANIIDEITTNKVQGWSLIKTESGKELKCSNSHLLYHPDYPNSAIAIDELGVGGELYVYEDEKLIIDLVENHEAIITIEEGSIGGFGSHVQQFLFEQGVFDKGFKFRSMVLPDVFVDQSSPEDMYHQAGLNASHIEDMVLSLLGLETLKQVNIQRLSFNFF